MEKKIRDLIQEIDGYVNKISNYSHLTSIQKFAYKEAIKKEINESGIEYEVNYKINEYYPNTSDEPISSIKFIFTDVYINDIINIEDVKRTGPFPISSRMNNCYISYEPRDLSKIRDVDMARIRNDEYIKLGSGDVHRIFGKLVECYWYQHGVSINVVGNEASQAIDSIINENMIEDNKNIAASAGRGILGSVIGIIVGFVFGIIMGLVVQIVSCVSSGSSKGSDKFNLAIIIVSAIIGGLLGFFSIFSTYREKKKK